MKHSKTIILILLFSGLLGFIVSYISHKNNIPIEQTTEMKVVRVSHSPATFVKQLVGRADAGEKIFKEFCASCHGKVPVIDIDAPRIGDKKIWARLKKVGKPALLVMTIQSVGSMPARGGCFECSDKQLRQAIEYILENSM